MPCIHIAGDPSSPTESFNEKEFLGNGEWPVGPSSVSPGSVPIPSPPEEGVDNAPKMVYKMSAKPRGIGNITDCRLHCILTTIKQFPGVVINNKYFTCGMKDRVGTDRDADSLTRLFTSLGFYTNRYDNLKGKDMRAKLQVLYAFISRCYTVAGCIVLVVALNFSCCPAK